MKDTTDGDSSRKDLHRLKRLELVEIIYALREENLALEERCASLKRRIDEIEELRSAAMANERSFHRLEQMLEIIYSKVCSDTHAEEQVREKA